MSSVLVRVRLNLERQTNEANHPSSTLRRAAKAIIADRMLRVNNGGGLAKDDGSVLRLQVNVPGTGRIDLECRGAVSAPLR